MIRFLDLISVPNDSWDSFILTKFNTLSIWREIVRSIGFTGVFQLIGHIFMMQMDSFHSGFDTVSRPHFRSEWLLRFIYFNKIQHFDPMERDCLVHSIYWCNSLNCAYFYDADGFLQFRLMIRVLELISVPNESWDSYILIKFNTLTQWSEIVRSIGFTGVFQLIAISLWCRWIPSISGFDTVSRPHFRSEWLLRFIYSNKIQHFVHMEGDC